MTTTSEVLNKAADIIEKHGLGKRDYYNMETGRYCTVGAIAAARLPGTPPENLYKVIGASDLLVREMRTVIETAGIKGAIAEPAITIWNDQPERTQAEVIATLRKAAKAVR